MAISRPVAAPVDELGAAPPAPAPAIAYSDRPAPAGAGYRAASTSIARGALALGSTQPITWAMTLLATILIPQYLGDRGLGELSLVFTITGMVGTLAALGIPAYLTRRAATHPADAAADGSAAVLLAVGLTLLATVTLSVALPLFGVSAGGSYVLPLALAGMIPGVAQGVLFSVLLGQERHARFAWLKTTLGILVSFAGLAVLIAGGGIRAYIATGLVSSVVLTALSWRLSGFRLQRQACELERILRLVRGGWRFLVWQMSLHVYGGLDRILLGIFSTTATIGWYDAAYRIISIPLFVPALIATPLLPVLSRHVGDREVFHRTVRNSLIVVLILTVPITGMIFTLAPVIPDLFGWDAAFGNSVPLMRVLALHMPFVGADMVLATALIALHREGRWLIVGLVAAVFNPSLCFAFIPLFEQAMSNGAMGAAVVTVATELLMMVGAILCLPRGIIDRPTVLVVLRVAGAGIGLTLTAFTILYMSLPLAMTLLLATCAGGAVYAGLLLVSRVVRPVELVTASGFVRSELLRRFGRLSTQIGR